VRSLLVLGSSLKEVRAVVSKRAQGQEKQVHSVNQAVVDIASE
jgi:hypothetical protein